MLSPKEGEFPEPPLALSGNDETIEEDQNDDYRDRSDNNMPLTPTSDQLEEEESKVHIIPSGDLLAAIEAQKRDQVMVEEQSEEKRKQKAEAKAKAAAEKGQFRQGAASDHHHRPANAVVTPTSEYEYGYEYYEEGDDNAETPAERQQRNNNQAQTHEVTDNTGTTPAGPQHPKSEYEYGYEYYGELTGSKKDIGSRDGLEGAVASEGEEYKDDEFDEVEDGVDLQEGDGQENDGIYIEGNQVMGQQIADVAVFSNLPASSADMVS